MAEQDPAETGDEERIEGEERRRARRPGVAVLRDPQEPVAVPPRPDVDGRPELVEPGAVPLAATGVERSVEPDDHDEREQPDRCAAPEEQPERGRRAARVVRHSATLTADPNQKGERRRDPDAELRRNDGYHRSMSAPRRRPQRGPDPDLPIRRRRRQRKRRRPLLVLLLIVAVLVVGAAVAGGTGVYAFGSSCDLSALHEVRIGQNTFVYAADGSLLGSIPAERNRQVVPLSRVSPWMPKATIAIEDRRFYSHGGVDPQGIARAVYEDVKAREVVQGGSTITQQLVRNLYISNERTVQRKLKEACLAIKLNDAWSKQRILASYLNQVYYGNLAYGIEAAAQTYFSKPASDLTLREAALLAGLTQAPSAYNPFVEPGKALARRNAVLRAMRDQGSITPRQYAWASRSRDLAPEARPALQGDPRAVLLRLRPRPADQQVRRRDGPLRRPQRLHDDRPALAAGRAGGDPGDAHRSGRSRRGGDLDRPRERRHPRDDGGGPGPQQQPVQPALAGAPAAGLDVQDVRARGGDREGDRSRHELLRLGAVHLQAGRRTATATTARGGA